LNKRNFFLEDKESAAMFAPITRSMTFTLGLCSAALCPDLLAETGPEKEPGRTLELGATHVFV